MIYGIANIANLLLIMGRFFIFSRFVDFNIDNAAYYSSLASLNSILPFLLIGISFGQNAVYPRFFKNKESPELLGFYNLCFIILASISIFSFIFSKSLGINIIYVFSLIQFSINYFYNQKRYEKIEYSIFLSLFEIIYISIIILIKDPTQAFSGLYFYYLIILGFGLIERFFNNNFHLSDLINKNNYYFNIKNLFFISPIVIKDNIDLIFVGIFAAKDLASSYAIVILCSAPAKILLSNLQITLNKYFADKSIYYESLFSKIGIKYILLAIIFNFIIVSIILNIFFSNISLEIFIASNLRSLGSIASFKMRSSYLDAIQINTKQSINKYKYSLLLSSAIIFISLIVFKLINSIYFLSSIALLISILGIKFYDNYDKKSLFK